MSRSRQVRDYEHGPWAEPQSAEANLVSCRGPDDVFVTTVLLSISYPHGEEKSDR